MNIAFIPTTLAFPWGGADKPWTRTAEAALAAGHQALLVVSPAVARHPKIQALQARGARVHERTHFTSKPGRWQRMRTLFDARARWGALQRTLEQFKPDVLLLNLGGTYDFLLEDQLVAWIERRHLPVVLYCHCNSDQWSLAAADRPRARAMFAHARAAVFVSTHNLHVTEHQLAADIPHAVVLQNPVDDSLLAEPFSWPESPTLTCAMVARIDAHHKGLDLLVPALQQAWGREHDWRVNLYGSGPDESYVNDLAARYNIGDRLHLRGFTSDLRAVWSQNQLLLMPSRHEGCSIAMLEALACGRPVLATSVGGVSDWLQDGVNGFISAAPTVEAIAATLVRARAHHAEWPEMGAAAARLYRERRDPAPEQKLLHLLAGAPSS